MIWTVSRLDRRADGMAVADDGSQARAWPVLPGEVISGEATAGRIATPRILTPSADRVVPPCPHYAACGGCSLMHAAPAFVAEWKGVQVRRALAARGIEARIGGIATSPEGARRRAVFSARRDREGLRLGFHARASDRITDIRECRVIRPDLVALLPVLREIAALAPRGAEVSITVNATESGPDIMMTGAPAPATARQAALPPLMEAGGLARLTWDDLTLTQRAPVLRMGPARVTPPPGAFLQATAEGEAALRAVVVKSLAGAARIADLFAGCGTFTLPLARGAEVHAVEGLPAPLAALDAAWRATSGLRRVTTETRDLAARPLMADELAGFDAAVIDPPRTGAAAQAAHLAAARLERVVWVSCDPVTFARDAATMIAGGWRIGPVWVVDQFRHSPHVETVTCLTRG
ncbi:MAG: class I SAM-dependent RNA methyltransferase [Paracoccus sp. (in: a-proteobacteria)]|nr:class I SAM-dependent RNA methyltransferase [Paracoccus sp. (in: a-proteobacteria)]